MERTGDDYFDSSEFRELLEDYEQEVSSGLPISLDADDLTDIADYYHYIGEFELADEAIEHALSLNPGAASPIVYKIREALANEDVKEAEALLEEISDKDDPEYLYMQAEVLVAQNKIDEADRLLRDHFMDVPSDEYQDFVFDVANIYMDYGVNDKAYEWMIRMKDNDSDEYKEMMGHLLLSLGKYRKSERIFNELLDKNPYSTSYWNALANVQFMEENYGDAITSSEYAIAIDPDDAEGILTKANGLFRLENYEEALKYYQRYKLLMPDNDFCELQQGVCLVCLNKVDEALVHLKKAEKLTYQESPYQFQVYQELVFAYSALDMPDEAMACIDRTKSIDCDHHEMEVLRGHLLLDYDRFEEARDVFAKVLEDTRMSPRILLRIIASFLDHSMPHVAYDMFRIYFKIVGDDCNEGYSYMALCCLQLAKDDEFLKYLNEAAERNPTEASMVLGCYFPVGMKVTEYYQYMSNVIKEKS